MRIGIVGQDFDGKFGVNTKYLSLIEEVGGHPLIISPASVQDFHESYPIEALLLPGGADLDSNRYSILPSFHQGYQNPFLEYFDEWILPTILGEVPVFGICRGFQSLNVFFGGTLVQHLWGHPYSHHRDELVHEVVSTTNGKFKVNSLHHQAIKTLAEDLNPLAVSHDKIIEAFQHDSLKIAAVQWHPEEIRDSFSISLFKSILS